MRENSESTAKSGCNKSAVKQTSLSGVALSGAGDGDGDGEN